MKRGGPSRLAGETVTLASVRFSSVTVEPGRDPERALLSRLVGEAVTLASVRFSSVAVEPGRDPERALLSRLVGEAVTLASVRFSPIIVEPGRDSLDLMHGQSVVMQGDFYVKIARV